MFSSGEPLFGNQGRLATIGANKPALAPGDRICFTAAAPGVPPPLLAQLAPGGRLIGPVGRPHEVQDLVLMIRQDSGRFRRVVVETVAYIPLRGGYGFSG